MGYCVGLRKRAFLLKSLFAFEKAIIRYRGPRVRLYLVSYSRSRQYTPSTTAARWHERMSRLLVKLLYQSIRQLRLKRGYSMHAPSNTHVKQEVTLLQHPKTKTQARIFLEFSCGN